MSIVDMNQLKQIAELEFGDIVTQADIGLNRMRIILNDTSFIDVWYSLNTEGRYSYHWDRKQIDGTIYRHNNAPHLRWKNVSTFPKHFHDKSESNVIESQISNTPEVAIRELLVFVREKGEKE